MRTSQGKTYKHVVGKPTEIFAHISQQCGWPTQGLGRRVSSHSLNPKLKQTKNRDSYCCYHIMLISVLECIRPGCIFACMVSTAGLFVDSTVITHQHLTQPDKVVCQRTLVGEIWFDIRFATVLFK